MIEYYPAKYSDKFGEEQTTIQNDGKDLIMVVREVEFRCSMLDDWEPTRETNPEHLKSFLIHPIFNTLYRYKLEFEIPIPVMKSFQVLQGILNIHLDIEGVETNHAGGREDLLLVLQVDEQRFESCGKHGWFDDELQEIVNAMPKDMQIKTCYGCAFSDYSPAGFGLYGGLACFRNTKQEYLSLKGKAAYFKLQDRMAGLVQETYLCDEFEKRIPGTGYRG